jgi:predicted DNA-binding transcriptional regulator YafY
MSKTLEALTRLNAVLNDAKTPLAKEELAKRSRLNVRSMERHLKFLKERLGAPLHCDKRRNTYGYRHGAGERFELPGIWFSKDELAALFSLRQLLGEIPEGALSSITEDLLRRIEKVSLEEGQLPDNGWSKKVKVIPIGGRSVSDEVFRTIVDGLVHGKRLSITQKSLGKESRSRDVSPLQIVRYRDNWYLDAWCHLRDDFRSFGLSRIHEARVLESNAVRKSSGALRDHYASSYGIFNGRADKVATIRFSDIAAEEVSKERWHSAQTGRDMGDGIYELDVPYHDDTELIMDVMRWGDEAVVIAPQDLHDKIKAKLRTALAAY